MRRIKAADIQRLSKLQRRFHRNAALSTALPPKASCDAAAGAIWSNRKTRAALAGTMTALAGLSTAPRPAHNEAEASAKTLAASDIVLYQYKICPFCNKLKAVMDHFGVQYRTTEVNPLTKAEISFSKDYRKVPILTMDGETHIDSPEIIRSIAIKLKDSGAMTPEQFSSFYSKEAQDWADWADKKLAVLLFPNITRNFSEASAPIHRTTSTSTTTCSYAPSCGFNPSTNDYLLDCQLLGSTAMWLAQGKLKKKYNITDEREALLEALATWKHELEGKPFAGGEHPHVGDLSVFGCIRAVEGLDTHAEVLEKSGLSEWYNRMKDTLDYGPM
ncbi:unnamed protein product [Chrysoparadoxa australica]